jgi:hypothetical protein
MLPGAKVPRSAPLPRGMVRRTAMAVTWGRGLPGLIFRAFGPWPVPTPSVIIALTDVKE